MFQAQMAKAASEVIVSTAALSLDASLRGLPLRTIRVNSSPLPNLNNPYFANC
jgi:hypothetical protein